MSRTTANDFDPPLLLSKKLPSNSIPQKLSTSAGSMTENNVINLGDLSKPATVLIEKISEAVGGIAKPWQLRRVAKAEAEVEKIKALANIEITEIQDRAIKRLIQEEGRKQENIESITQKAIPNLTETAQPENIDPDWLTHFFEKSRIVSNEDMQALWGRILAAEANAPSTFSKRTVEIVSTLSRKDAEIFTRFCTYAWQFQVLEPVYWYDGSQVPGEAKDPHELDFGEITHLVDLGLINFDLLSEFVWKRNNNRWIFFYYGAPIQIELNTNGNVWSLSRGNVSLTQTGQELAGISGSRPNRKYLDSVLRKWMEDGHVITVPLSAKNNWINLHNATEA